MSHIQILSRQVEGPGLEVHAFSLSVLEALGWQTAVVIMHQSFRELQLMLEDTWRNKS